MKKTIISLTMCAGLVLLHSCSSTKNAQSASEEKTQPQTPEVASAKEIKEEGLNLS